MARLPARLPPPTAAAAQAPPPPEVLPPVLMTAVRDVMRMHWGHDEFRPLQAEALAASLAGRDALVILPTGAAAGAARLLGAARHAARCRRGAAPTCLSRLRPSLPGGGKSLTFQLPPLYRNQGAKSNARVLKPGDRGGGPASSSSNPRIPLPHSIPPSPSTRAQSPWWSPPCWRSPRIRSAPSPAAGVPYCARRLPHCLPPGDCICSLRHTVLARVQGALLLNHTRGSPPAAAPPPCRSAAAWSAASMPPPGAAKRQKR